MPTVSSFDITFNDSAKFRALWFVFANLMKIRYPLTAAESDSCAVGSLLLLRTNMRRQMTEMKVEYKMGQYDARSRPLESRASSRHTTCMAAWIHAEAQAKARISKSGSVFRFAI